MRFIRLIDEENEAEKAKKNKEKKVDDKGKEKDHDPDSSFHYFISRGVELTDDDDGMRKFFNKSIWLLSDLSIFSVFFIIIILKKAKGTNSCVLHQLKMPSGDGQKFEIEEVRAFQDDE